MACPDQHLDFCFTFEMAITPEEELKFLLSTAKAGFIAAATPSFFDNYRREGRSIREHQLNLTPQEEQKLWQMLDREMQQGAHWDYSFLTTNCSSMCVWIVEEALWASGERIDYGQLPQAVTGTYRDLLDELSADYPWARLFWNLRMGSKGEERGELRDKLAPALLEQAWQQAVITDKEGHSRPMVVGDSVQHAEQTFRPKSALITPMGVTAAMLIFILLTIIMFILKKRKR